VVSNGKDSKNGHRPSDGKIRVAIVGVGNCASSLVQGRYYYEKAKDGDHVPGLMHVNLGGYHVRDIEFVAAFDIDKTKVGKDLSEAVFAGQNNTFKFSDVPHTGVTVDRGMTHDGLGKYLSQVIEKAPGPTADVVGILKERKVDVMVSYLPVGSEEATKWLSSRPCRPASASSMPSPFSSAASRTGSDASPSVGCRSSVTTSRARSARPSRTAS
jgi:Myo-inositol-1-phosphate synthase